MLVLLNMFPYRTMWNIFLTCSLVPHTSFFYALLWFHRGQTGHWESGPLEYPCQDNSVIRIRGDNTFWFSARIFLSIERRNRECFLLCCTLQKKQLREYFSDLSGPQRTESSKCVWPFNISTTFLMSLNIFGTFQLIKRFTFSLFNGIKLKQMGLLLIALMIHSQLDQNFQHAGISTTTSMQSFIACLMLVNEH